MNRQILNYFFVLLVSFSFSAEANASVSSAWAQWFEVGPSKYITQTYQSPDSEQNSERPSFIPYRVIFPPEFPKCSTSERCYKTVYFLHGRNGNAKMLEDLGVIEALNEIAKASQGPSFLIVLPEGGNNYWMNAAIERTGKSRWTNFVAEELVKDVETRFPVMREPKARLLAGISMGGHGALQIALNRPGIFGFVAAHSPVLRAVNNLEGLHDQFGTGADYEQRDPLSLIRRKGQIFFEGLWLDIGRGDFSYERTWEFANELRARFDHHQLWIDNTSSDGHDLSYWKRRLPEYLGWYQQVLTKPSLRAPTKPF